MSRMPFSSLSPLSLPGRSGPRRLAVCLCACALAASAPAAPQMAPAAPAAPASAAASASAPGAQPRAARQAGAPIRLRVVGGLGGISQYTRFEQPFWTTELPRLSGGRLSADIVPFDRAGIPGVEMLRLLQLGVVPFGTALMSSFSSIYPQYTAVDLPGLSGDVASLRAATAAFRPYLEQALRQEQGVELLALYIYPAQITFCKHPLKGLSDLRGRRVRVSSPAQADFIAAVGAEPVVTSFTQQRNSLESGDTECAVTGGMAGNTLGVDTLTRYLHPLPLNWGMAVFGANQAAWNALPPEDRQLLRTELARLEGAIWDNAERETSEGVACNLGRSDCRTGRRGAMTLVPVSEADERLRVEIFRTTVLPRWLRRCAVRCDQIWARTIGTTGRGADIFVGP